jgi:hypothetical protein
MSIETSFMAQKPLSPCGRDRLGLPACWLASLERGL